MSRALEAEAYVRMKDSGKSGPVFECPACGEDAYIDFLRAVACCAVKRSNGKTAWFVFSRIPIEDALAGFDEGIAVLHSYRCQDDDSYRATKIAGKWR